MWEAFLKENVSRDGAIIGYAESLWAIFWMRHNPKDLELAVGRFESGGLSGILELEGAIETAKMTHLLIQESGLGVSRIIRSGGELYHTAVPSLVHTSPLISLSLNLNLNLNPNSDMNRLCL